MSKDYLQPADSSSSAPSPAEPVFTVDDGPDHSEPAVVDVGNQATQDLVSDASAPSADDATYPTLAALDPATFPVDGLVDSDLAASPPGTVHGVDAGYLDGRVEQLLAAGTNGAAAVMALRGLDQEQLAALEEKIEAETGKDLSELLSAGADGKGGVGDGSTGQAAKAYAEGDKAAGAIAELLAIVDPKDPESFDVQKVKAALAGLGPEEIDQVGNLSMNYASLMYVVEDGNLLGKAKDQAHQADEELASLPAPALEAMGVDPTNPTTLCTLGAAELEEVIAKGWLTRDAVLNLGKRYGMDPAVVEGVALTTDPNKGVKDAKAHAQSLLDDLETDIDGEMTEWMSGLGDGAEVAQHKIEMLWLKTEVTKLMANGSMSADEMEAEVASLEAYYNKKIGKDHNAQFGEFNETAAEVKAGLEITKAITTFAAKKTAWATTMLLTGGQIKLADGAEALTGGSLEMIGSTLDQWLVEDREFPEAAKTGFVNGLFAGGKDYMLSLFGKGGAGKEAGKLLVGTGMDTAKGVYQETDKYNKDYDEFMSGAHKGKSGEVPDVLKNPKSMTNIVASQGGKAVLSNAAGAVTGKAGEESAAGGVVTAITANAASDVGGKAIDALSKQGSEDEDLDLQRALEGAASKKTKDLSSTSGLLENFLSPAVSQSMEQTKPAFVSAVDKG